MVSVIESVFTGRHHVDVRGSRRVGRRHNVQWHEQSHFQKIREEITTKRFAKQLCHKDRVVMVLEGDTIKFGQTSQKMHTIFLKKSCVKRSYNADGYNFYVMCKTVPYIAFLFYLCDFSAKELDWIVGTRSARKRSSVLHTKCPFVCERGP
jgi:hypothetical protein